MAPDIPQLITPGVIAERLGESLSRVLHILRTRAHIRPAARAGTLRLYSEQAVEAVRQELESIDGRREGGSK